MSPRGGTYNEYFIDAKTGYALVAIYPDKEDDRVSITWLARTTDGGLNWKLIRKVSVHIAGLHFIDENEGWMWSGRGSDVIYHTTDGGKTWDGSEYLGLEVESMYFINKQEGWLLSWGTADNSLGRNYHPSLFGTTDGGKTWKFIGMDQMEKNPDLYFGSKPFFPNWSNGNMFLFRLKKFLKIDECRSSPEKLKPNI